jgi:hypothetical protein
MRDVLLRLQRNFKKKIKINQRFICSVLKIAVVYRFHNRYFNSYYARYYIFNLFVCRSEYNLGNYSKYVRTAWQTLNLEHTAFVPAEHGLHWLHVKVSAAASTVQKDNFLPFCKLINFINDLVQSRFIIPFCCKTVSI